MQHIIGDKGNGYYSVAYEIYSIMLIISCYSLPLAVSKVVSSKISKRQYKSAERAFQCAMLFCGGSRRRHLRGLRAFGRLFAADVMQEPMRVQWRSKSSARIAAGVCDGVFRGYFQGLGTMMPTAVSQILEQIFVLIGSIVGGVCALCAWQKIGALMHNADFGPAYGAAGASIGPVIGAVVGLVFLAFVFAAYRRGRQEAGA